MGQGAEDLDTALAREGVKSLLAAANAVPHYGQGQADPFSRPEHRTETAESSLAAANAEIERLTVPDGYATVPIAFPNMRTGAELVAVPSDIFSSSPTKSQQREHALIERAEAAEATVATLTARVAELEAGLKLLADCGSAAVGADPLDPDAQEAFDMWSDARRSARALLQKDKNHG